MSVQPGGAVVGPGPVERRKAPPVAIGDVVAWHDRLARIDDVADFGTGGRWLTLHFLDGRGLPLSLRLTDLEGAP